MNSTDIDVIVIGSGAGGAACAWRLSNKGLRVLLLEAGPEYNISDYRLHLDGWEKSIFPAKVETENRQTVASMQKLDPRWDHLHSWNHLRGRFIKGNTRYFGRYDHVIGLGGSTLHFTGEAHRMHPRSMQMYTDYQTAADWPVTYQELDPYYTLAEKVIGVAGSNDDTHRPRSEPYPLPPHALSYASQKLKQGARKMRLNWEANPQAALSKPYNGRPGCNYCGNCGRGCPRRDKGSVDVSFIPAALATSRCNIKTSCTVLHLQPGIDDRIKAVIYKDADDSIHQVTAPIVVLACGAVETPRLLLASANSHAPDGLANESGQVGKNFMETLSWYSCALHPEPLASYRGLPSDSICWDFNAPDAIPGVIGGCRFSPYTSEADLVGPINYAERVIGGWGKQHQKQMRKSFGNVLAVGAIGEHLPNKSSYIDLDPTSKDANGIARARIHSHLTEMDLKRMDFMRKTCRELLEASGASEIFEEAGTYDIMHATHVFGTCRMGNDAESSVVNSDCRSHRWHNLYIVDASVFPSSGGGEAPSLTIEALAIMAADRIAAQSS